VAEVVATAAAVEADAAPEGEDAGVSRKRLGITFWLAVGVLTVIVLGCLLNTRLPFVKDFRLPDASRTGRAQSFSAEHWLGTDNLGRDNLARILEGGRTSLRIAFSVTVLGFVGGGLLGLIAGYFKGWTERILMGIVDIFLAFPALVLALAIISVLEGDQGASVNAIITALSVIAVPPLARITRATTLQFSQREFVTAARSMGAGHLRIIRKEILPNVLPPMVSFSLVVVAIVLVAEAGLGVIGLGLPKDKFPTWGNMISSGANGVPNALRDHASVALTPAAVVFLTVLSLNLIGDKLRQRFDVKESGV
jgi:peptide/nickel transport system permease protein